MLIDIRVQDQSLKKLHWLPIQQNINFKMILLSFKALRGLTVTYISELLSKIVSRELRNNNGLLLVGHTPNSTFGERAFSVAAPNYGTSCPL